MLLPGQLTISSNSFTSSPAAVLRTRPQLLANRRAIVVSVTFSIVNSIVQYDVANAGSVPVNPQTGQPDYTAQWIQYYRSIGAIKDAEALEQQLKAKVRDGFTARSD